MRKGFDAFQRWLSAFRRGDAGFYKGCYFAVIESQQADAKALERFTQAIEQALPAGGEVHWLRH